MITETEIRNFFDIPIEHFPDRSARWLLQDKENVRGLIEIVASELVETLDFRQLVQINRSFISDTLREQESDIVFRVPFHSRLETDELLIYVLIEHQSTVDAAMGFRVLFYMTQIWDSQRREWESDNVPKSEWRLPPILPIVFYTGAQRWNIPLSLTGMMDVPDLLSRFVPTFDTLLLSVKETDPAYLTRTEHPLGWLLTVLQKENADKESIGDALLAAMSRLNVLDTEQAEQRQRAITYLLLLILHRRPTEEHEDLITLVDEHTYGMEVETMAQSIIELSEKRGERRGERRGETRGETRAKREAILKLLRFRFNSVPDSVTTGIASIRSLSRLDSLFEQALAAETLDEINLLIHDG